MERCKTCKHAMELGKDSPFPPEFRVCMNMSVEQENMGTKYYRMYESFMTDGELIVSPNFGCVLWEAKDAD